MRQKYKRNILGTLLGGSIAGLIGFISIIQRVKTVTDDKYIIPTDAITFIQYISIFILIGALIGLFIATRKKRYLG